MMQPKVTCTYSDSATSTAAASSNTSAAAVQQQAEVVRLCVSPFDPADKHKHANIAIRQSAAGLQETTIYIQYDIPNINLRPNKPLNLK